MKNRNRRYALAIICCIIFVLTLPACRKFVEIAPAANSIVTSQVFADSVDATAAINGIYINMMNSAGTADIANGLTSITAGLSADELTATSTLASYQEFYVNAITVTNTNDATLWNTAYAYIYQANACIAGVAASTTISTTLKNRITGEAKFIRAFMHFYLVNLYGPVPLIVSIDYNVNASLPRASVADIYTQINIDLKDAQSLLNSDPVAINKLRVNRFAVSAFLARVQLYQQQWAAAESAATTVINNTAYQLEPKATIGNVFLVGSQEEIWQMTPPAPGDETTVGQLIIPSTATTVPSYIISFDPNIVFEANDQRRTQWLNTVTVAGKTYTYPYKYKLRRDNATAPKEAYSMLRLAEQYLIRAEARAQQGNLSGAISDLNMIRTRAGLLNTPAVNQADILTAVQRERRVELFSEWGHRWLDLKRTNTIDAVLSINKTGWQATAALYPVPNAQMLLNPFLTQNPGY